MTINKKANENLPQDLQDTINTFIEQVNIVEEYNLDTMPIEYFINLLNKLYDYNEYDTVMELITLIEDIVNIKKNINIK